MWRKLLCWVIGHRLMVKAFTSNTVKGINQLAGQSDDAIFCTDGNVNLGGFDAENQFQNRRHAMGIEDGWDRKDVHDGNEHELVRCGSLIENPEETVYAVLMKNKTEGEETITFAKKDWAHMETYLVDVQNQIIALSKLTPVKDAHGLCKVTACQWNALSDKRALAARTEVKLEATFKILDRVTALLNKIFIEKLLAVEGWWGHEYARLNREIEDLKRL